MRRLDLRKTYNCSSCSAPTANVEVRDWSARFRTEHILWNKIINRPQALKINAVRVRDGSRQKGFCANRKDFYHFYFIFDDLCRLSCFGSFTNGFM